MSRRLFVFHTDNAKLVLTKCNSNPNKWGYFTLFAPDIQAKTSSDFISNTGNDALNIEIFLYLHAY